MKRLLTIAALLVCLSANAQTYKSPSYKPLEPVDVPVTSATAIEIYDFPGYDGTKMYFADHDHSSKSMMVDLSVPANCNLSFWEKGLENIAVGNTAKLSIGGVQYYLKVSFISDEKVSDETQYIIDLKEDHVRHIAVSGLQSITFMDWGEVLYEITYNPVEQELWRRTAEEVGKAAYIIM